MRDIDGLPLHLDVGDKELGGVGVHLTLGQLDVAGHPVAGDCSSMGNRSRG